MGARREVRDQRVVSLLKSSARLRELFEYGAPQVRPRTSNGGLDEARRSSTKKRPCSGLATRSDRLHVGAAASPHCTSSKFQSAWKSPVGDRSFDARGKRHLGPLVLVPPNCPLLGEAERCTDHTRAVQWVPTYCAWLTEARRSPGDAAPYSPLQRAQLSCPD